MNAEPDLERRYRRVLRLLPGYYRARWEEDMVAAFLESCLTGDQEEDEFTLEFGRPTWPEVASVAAQAARLYLGGAGAPDRYFAWGQAVRGAVLAVLLFHAVRGLDGFVRLAWAHRLLGVPAPPASVLVTAPGGFWPNTFYQVGYVWIAVYGLLILGRYRAARVLAALAVLPDLAALVQTRLAGSPPAVSAWAYWALLEVVPVAAMAAFHVGAPPVPRRPWLPALPAAYLLVCGPVLAIQATGNAAWLPDIPGICCLLVALACLAQAPRAWSRTWSRSRLRPSAGAGAGAGVWSLTLTLLAALAAANRIASLGDYQHDPHLTAVSLAELLILAVAAALVAPDAGRALRQAPGPPGRLNGAAGTGAGEAPLPC
jgi:hypothetical protein